MKKKILLYYYYEEVRIDSYTSVTRLAASLLNGLKDEYDCYILTYESSGAAISEGFHYISVTVRPIKRFLRKLNNAIGFRRIHWIRLKRAAARQALKSSKEQYDVVIVPGLDDMADVRTLYPDAKIIYWIHNISAICKPHYLQLINNADYFVTPSRSAYHLLLAKMPPAPLLAEYYFMPNWCEETFYKEHHIRVAELRLQYDITTDAVVFIFSGGDHPVKGKQMLEKIMPQLEKLDSVPLVFIFAGSKQPYSRKQNKNITVISVGLLSADELAAHYQLSHIGLFPSMGYDHTPLTLLEMALSHVLPIASDIGGIKEILGANYPYLVKDPHSSKQWIEKIADVIALPVQQRRLIVEQVHFKIGSVYNRANSIQIMKEILYK